MREVSNHFHDYSHLTARGNQVFMEVNMQGLLRKALDSYAYKHNLPIGVYLELRNMIVEKTHATRKSITNSDE